MRTLIICRSKHLDEKAKEIAKKEAEAPEDALIVFREMEDLCGWIANNQPLDIRAIVNVFEADGEIKFQVIPFLLFNSGSNFPGEDDLLQ